MSERSTLRGSRLGGTSFEDESGIDFAPRQDVPYLCPNGHDFTIAMAEEVEVPYTWECPRCGAVARHRDASEPEKKAEKPTRTHWDMLLERRSIPELEEILSERLQLLRSGEIGPAHLHHRRAAARRTPRTKKSA